MTYQTDKESGNMMISNVRQVTSLLSAILVAGIFVAAFATDARCEASEVAKCKAQCITDEVKKNPKIDDRVLGLICDNRCGLEPASSLLSPQQAVALCKNRCTENKSLCVSLSDTSYSVCQMKYEQCMRRCVSSNVR